MECNFIPKKDALQNTDWRKPEVDKKDVKKLILIGLAAAMFVVVFIPWFCLGLEADTIGSVKLRAFGFHTWYGIAAAVLALVAAAGVLYKHLSLTFCSAILAVLVGFYAVNDYPTCRLSVSLSGELEEASEIVASASAVKAPNYYDYGDDEWDEYEEAMEKYSKEMEKYEKQLEKLDINRSAMQVIEGVNQLNELPSYKVPGQFVEAAALLVECVDQGFLYEALEKAGIDKEIEKEIGGFDIINNRLGSVLYLIFAIFAAALSYMIISGCNLCCCKKKECAAPAAPAESADTTVVNE